MPERDLRLALGQSCRHCGHLGSMEIVAAHTANSHWAERRLLYELLVCPACDNVTLRSSAVLNTTDVSGVKLKTLYPANPDDRFGMQNSITRPQSSEQLKSRTFILRCLTNIHEFCKEWKAKRI